MTKSLVSLAVIFVLGACANATATDVSARTEVDDGAFEIALAKSSYGWEEASHEGVRGTIRNVSDQPLYSNLGDAMVSSAEQDVLYLASSDGGVERHASSATWTRMPSIVMVEGTRYVVLRPGRTYQFIAPVGGAPQTGTFRIAVSFRSTIDDEEQASTGTSHSASFTIH